METLIIKPKNKEDLKFWMELAKKTGTAATKLTLEEVEDLGLTAMMNQEKSGELVSKEEVFKSLGK